MYFVAIKMGPSAGEAGWRVAYWRLDLHSGNYARYFVRSPTIAATGNAPVFGLTSFVVDLTLWIMGDKSPKAAHKHAAQKQEKAKAANQKKNNAASAKQVPKPK